MKSLPTTIYDTDMAVKIAMVLEQHSSVFKSYPSAASDDLLIKSFQIEQIAQTVEDPELKRELLVLAVSFRRAGEAMFSLTSLVIVKFGKMVDGMQTEKKG